MAAEFKMAAKLFYFYLAENTAFVEQFFFLKFQNGE
jgi:hypothetical protein